MGGGASEFLDSPTVNKEADLHFLNQIAASDEDAMHVVIGDGAGFHHRNGGGELPANLKIITLPAYSPELNPVEKFWDIVKDTIVSGQQSTSRIFVRDLAAMASMQPGSR